MKILIDAFGGDNSPEQIIAGSIDAVNERTDFTAVLVGDEQIIKDQLKNYQYPQERVEIINAPEIITCEEEPTVAIVKCNGGKENAKDEFAYMGNPTCAAANTLMGGYKACKTACLGCGDCAEICPEHAISVEGGVSKVDPDKCVSCGACISACPKGIIERIPVSAPVYVACSSKCKGKETMGNCKVGCIACGLCAKNCPNGAITMQDNLPVFDYSKCNGCLTCVAKCPRKIILKR